MKLPFLLLALFLHVVLGCGIKTYKISFTPIVDDDLSKNTCGHYAVRNVCHSLGITHLDPSVLLHRGVQQHSLGELVSALEFSGFDVRYVSVERFDELCSNSGYIICHNNHYVALSPKINNLRFLLDNDNPPKVFNKPIFVSFSDAFFIQVRNP